MIIYIMQINNFIYKNYFKNAIVILSLIESALFMIKLSI